MIFETIDRTWLEALCLGGFDQEPTPESQDAEADEVDVKEPRFEFWLFFGVTYSLHFVRWFAKFLTLTWEFSIERLLEFKLISIESTHNLVTIFAFYGRVRHLIFDLFVVNNLIETKAFTTHRTLIRLNRRVVQTLFTKALEPSLLDIYLPSVIKYS